MALLLIPQVVQGANGSYDQGVRFYQAKKFHDALVQFEAAFTMGYEPANCLYYAALCHQQLNDFAKAKEVYTEIVTRYGTTPAAANARAALEGLKRMPSPAVSATAAAQATTPATKDGIVGDVSFAESREGMIVPVIIQGKPVRAIWDSGATTCFFAKSQLDKAGIDTRKAVKAGRAIGIGGEIETYRLDTLVIVGNVGMQLPVYFQDDTAEQRNTNRIKEDFGLLGEDFFSHFVYQVDPAIGKIRFLRPAKSEARYKKPTYKRASGDDVAFTWENGVMVVTPKVNGRECDMIFDTGAATVAFSDKQLTAAGMTRPTDSRNAISYGVGGSRTAYAFSLNSVELGPISRTGVAANVSVFGTQGRPLLGQNFLRGVKYTVDPEQCVMKFVSEK
jgi:clan AA aspartic protease (TIGR02281 family)